MLQARLLLLCFATLLAGFARVGAAQTTCQTETFHQAFLCDGMEVGAYDRANKAHVDCLSPTHAYEVDWSAKWKEAMGQAIAYASIWDRAPGIILLCEAPHANETEASTRAVCSRRTYAAQQALEEFRIPAAFYLCDCAARDLARDCSLVMTGAVDIGG